MPLTYREKSNLKRGLYRMSKQSLFSDLVSRLESAGVAVVSLWVPENSKAALTQPPSDRHLPYRSSDVPAHESMPLGSGCLSPLVPVPSIESTP